MTKDTALRFALEALEMFCEHGAILRPIEIRNAIKAALEAKDEPVAWMSTHDVGFKRSEFGMTQSLSIKRTIYEKSCWV
jgi:hypothetical protein